MSGAHGCTKLNKKTYCSVLLGDTNERRRQIDFEDRPCSFRASVPLGLPGESKKRRIGKKNAGERERRDKREGGECLEKG